MACFSFWVGEKLRYDTAFAEETTLADPTYPIDDGDEEKLIANAATAATAQQDDQTVESALEMALPAIESGIAPDTIINAMFANLPEHLKQQLRQRMGQAVAARDARQHEMHKETQEKSARATGVRRAIADLTAIAALISEETMDRIKKLFLARPDIAQAITKEGQNLVRFGVTPEMIRLSETQLGQLSPPAIGQGQGRARDEGQGPGIR